MGENKPHLYSFLYIDTLNLYGIKSVALKSNMSLIFTPLKGLGLMQNIYRILSMRYPWNINISHKFIEKLLATEKISSKYGRWRSWWKHWLHCGDACGRGVNLQVYLLVTKVVWRVFGSLTVQLRQFWFYYTDSWQMRYCLILPVSLLIFLMHTH